MSSFIVFSFGVIKYMASIAGRGSRRFPMVSTTAIRNLIREDRIFQIASVIQSGGVEGMQNLDQDLQRLVTQGKIERKVAMDIADNPKLFKQNVL